MLGVARAPAGRQHYRERNANSYPGIVKTVAAALYQPNCYCLLNRSQKMCDRSVTFFLQYYVPIGNMSILQWRNT
jgi:hypothetical protein